MGKFLECNWTVPHLVSRGPTVLMAVGLRGGMVAGLEAIWP